MDDKLSKMTLEELWHLFPIYLEKHNSNWINYYKEQEELLNKIIPHSYLIRISHIGSTAIPTIWAKPIIDILLEVTPNISLDIIKDILIKNDFRLMSKNNNCMSFNKGYTEFGFADKVYHLHLRYKGDDDELYFRNYLLDNPKIAKEYEELKLNLGNLYKYNRDAYTNAKSEFVLKYTNIAKKNK